jgi:hypothetical protein
MALITPNLHKEGFMFKKLLVAATMLFASATFAKGVPTLEMVSSLQQQTMSQAHAYGLNWTVGDNCHYDMVMGSFMKGTMEIVVREKNDEGYWLDQNLDLGFMGKQKISLLIDPNTGAVKKVIVNGKEEQPPEQGDVEVIEVKEAKITVPAGTFDAVYFRAKDKKQNQEIQQWANPKLIPIMGLIKSVSPSQMGEIVNELTSFERK